MERGGSKHTPRVDDAPASASLGAVATLVREAIDEASDVDASRIDVAIADGVIVLRGAAPTAEQATAAALAAEEAAGGAPVANALTVDRGIEENRDQPTGESGGSLER